MMDLDEIIQDFDVLGYVERFGKARRSSRTNVSVYPCPMCGDSRRDKFYINVSGEKRNGYWNAYCCHEEGRLPRLIMAIEDIDFSAARRLIIEEVEGLDRSKLVPVIKGPVAKNKEKEATGSEIDLPIPLVPAKPEMKMIFRGKSLTLADRGVDKYIIERHRLCVTGKACVFRDRIRPDLANRLIIPIYSSSLPSSMVSWQARDLTDKADRKYVFPTGDVSTETLYGMAQATSVDTLILVEGAPAKWAFDRLGIERDNRDIENCAVASFGKSLSETQQKLIVAHPARKLVIAWDLDAASQIHKIAQKMSGKKKVFIMIPSDDGRDWDELNQDELVSAMLSAKPYTFALAARMRTHQALLGK